MNARDRGGDDRRKDDDPRHQHHGPAGERRRQHQQEPGEKDHGLNHHENEDGDGQSSRATMDLS